MVLKKDTEANQEVTGATQEAAEATGKTAAIETVKQDTDNAPEGRQETDSEKKPAASKCFVYIGPTLPNGRLKGNAIYSGSREEVTAHLAGVLEDYPLVHDLIIPVEELAEQRVKVSTPGNYIHKCYTDVVAAARK